MPTEPLKVALRRCRVGATVVSSSVDSRMVTQRNGSRRPVADARCCFTACTGKPPTLTADTMNNYITPLHVRLKVRLLEGLAETA